MNGEDKELGMGRSISRRDFVNGVMVGVGAAAVISSGAARAQSPYPSFSAGSPDTYPPLRHDLRGDEEGANSWAHALRDGDVFSTAENTGETYDLVVIGGGLSGLSAAWFYREKAGPNARILVLDVHDDFGGHAKCNEYVHNGMQLLVPGGSLFMTGVASWPRDATRLVEHFGIGQGIPGDILHTDHYMSRGMGQATLFRKEAYGGKDQLVMGGTPSRPTKEFLAKAPLAPKVKVDLARLMNDEKIDYMPGVSLEDKIARLQKMTYQDYLLNVAKVDPEVLKYTGGVWCLSNDTASAYFAHFRRKPGFAGLGMPASYFPPESAEHRASDYRPPRGNHSIARLIVRDLIPDSLPPGEYIAVETERVNYAALDRPGQATRIRLQSTVIRAEHIGDAPGQFDKDNREVKVTYIGRDGRAKNVVGKDVIMAGHNNMLPYICPEIGEEQKEALHKNVRTINVNINILIRNWNSFDKLKISNISIPKNLINSINLATPRTFGALRPSLSPDQPNIVHFGGGNGISNEFFIEHICGGLPASGTSQRDYQRIARAGLFQTNFETFEREVRSTAVRALGAGGFDPARDIVGITVNRWGHGYTLGDNILFDDENAPRSWEVGRRKFGRISIANADASGVDNAHTAIDEAARAVRELEPRMYGYYGFI